jgi:L-ascorbate metabolism protein UlaG (beta-lactamase superfamily)
MTPMSAMKIVLTVLAVLVTLLLAGIGGLRAWQPGMDLYSAHRAPAAAQGAVTATWFGVTAVLIRDGEHAVLIDPFFTRPPGLLNLALNQPITPDEARIEAWLRRAGVDRLDAVLVSHSHYDHAMDAGVVARLTGATLLGSDSTAQIGRGAGLPETQIRIVKSGETAAFGPFGLTFIDSRHAGATGGTPTGDIGAPLVPPARYLDYKLGGAYSILIRHPRGGILHHGSAGFVPGALRGQQADVALLGVALVEDLDAYLAETVDAVGAKRLLPTHWDDFTRPLDEPLRPMPLMVRLDRFFGGMARRPDVKVETFTLGQSVTLF